MLGYPGAGKTTVASYIAKLTGAYHLSSDALRAELFPQPTFNSNEHAKLYKILDEKTVSALEAGQDVIYDANLNRMQHRQEKYDICKHIGAQPVLVWVQTPKPLAKKRASDTSRQHLWPKLETPDAMFDRIADVIEPPTAKEPYIALNGTDATESYIGKVLGLE